MFWNVVGGAFLMLLGILVGVAIARPGKDGFLLLLTELEKMHCKPVADVSGRVVRCLTCDWTMQGDTWEQAREELDHHIRSNHPEKIHSIEIRDARTAPAKCALCGMEFESQHPGLAIRVLVEHMKETHPEYITADEKEKITNG